MIIHSLHTDTTIKWIIIHDYTVVNLYPDQLLSQQHQRITSVIMSFNIAS